MVSVLGVMPPCSCASPPNRTKRLDLFGCQCSSVEDSEGGRSWAGVTCLRFGWAAASDQDLLHLRYGSDTHTNSNVSNHFMGCSTATIALEQWLQ